MTLVRAFFIIVSFLNKFFQEFLRWKWMRRGYEEAIDDVSKEQMKRVKKAKQVRDNVTDQPIDSLQHDPYLRD